ncbi:hypothetical protein JXI42_03045 [bacterium]|nr:hypothetical protein [bacterium]
MHDSCAGVFGQDGAGEDYTTFGVYGLSTSEGSDAAGVFGRATGHGLSFGVVGETKSTISQSSGVKGISSADLGVTYGVMGKTNSFSSHAAGGGQLQLNNAAGAANFQVDINATAADLLLGGAGVGGILKIEDSDGFTQAEISATGATFVNHVNVLSDLNVSGTKSFIAPHPEMEDKNIKFYCAESPEVMVEYRGVVELTHGYGETGLPHEFILMSEPGTYSVMCTPQDWDNQGVGAKVDENGNIMIKELNSGEGNFKVAYTVYATRLGYKDHPVVVDKQAMR